MRILYCDDDTEDRREWKEKITIAWNDLKKNGVLFEVLELETCPDIFDASDIKLAPSVTDARSVTDLGGFDGFLIDILWEKGDEVTSHGVDIAESLRSFFPEKPIMMFTQAADPTLFNRLLDVDICAYLSKNESYNTLCLQISERMGKALSARGGQCLYKHIRLLANRNGWQHESVSMAASETWKLERSHDRWDAFWHSFSKPIAEHSLTFAFTTMRNFFKEADLLMLGTLPGMRGHLDHVLNVYFTGYVISNANPRFRKAALEAAKRLFPDKYCDISLREDYYWGLFQLAWLAAATLHDTAYPLEILPDLLKKCDGIRSHFGAVLKVDKTDPSKTMQEHLPELDEAKIENLAAFLVKLHGGNHYNFLINNSQFRGKDSVLRINHGVASGLLFMELVQSALSQKGTSLELETYLTWAATAMSLHSLKIPGSTSSIKISLQNDPLSYLLMACDEIQVWERERPDTSHMKSPFKETDLVEFTVSEDNIKAKVDYSLYKGAAASIQFAEIKETLNKAIEQDGQVLCQYLDGGGLQVFVNQIVSSEMEEFSPLRF